MDTQQFIREARGKGVPDGEIYKYLENKGLLTQPNPVQQEKRASGGLLGYVAPVLSTLPQAIGLAVGAKETAKTSQSLEQTTSRNADTAVQLVRQIQQETDPIKKERLRKTLHEVAANNQEISLLMNELASGKGLEEATAIKLGPLADIPGLSTDPGRTTQQIGGRSIAQLGVSAVPALGAAGSGALIGAGRGIEAGKDPVGIATESALTAAGFKLFGFGSDKILGTQFGQRIVNSPVGSTVLKVGGKLFSPFLAKASPAGTFGAEVDTAFKTFGQAVDRLYSPATYLNPVKNAVNYVGEKTGLRGTPEQRFSDAQKKVTQYWENQANRYKDTINYAEKSPRVLGEEGVIPGRQGNSFNTRDQVEIVTQKASAEHSYLNRILEESKLYASVDGYKRAAIKQITDNFKGVEREAALRAFDRQFNALIKDNASQVIEGVDGKRIPLRTLNDIKSYMWSEGYGPKLVKSDALYAKAMRISGNAAKNYIDAIARQENEVLADTISKLNEHSGDLFQAAKFLKAMHGRRLAGGQLGRYFAQTTGSIIGSAGGPIGSVAGTLTADQLVTILQNPQFSVGRAATLIAQVRKVNPEVVEEALQLLNEMAVKQASMKLLGSGPIVLPPPSGTSGVTPIPKNYPKYPADVDFSNTPSRLLPGKGQTSNQAIKLPKKMSNRVDYTGK